MKILLGLLSLFSMMSSNIFAGTFFYSELNEKDKEILEKNYDSDYINYNIITEEIRIDSEFEKELKQKGFLIIQDAKKTTVCNGGGEG